MALVAFPSGLPARGAVAADRLPFGGPGITIAEGAEAEGGEAMPVMTRYDHGVPSWVDLSTPDVASASAFYGALLGWQAQDLGPDSGHYTMQTVDGHPVAAIAPAQDPGPPRWTTYVDVDHADKAAAAVAEAGGEVVVAPMDVMTAGRMAVFRDLTGALIAAWQPGDHTGAGLVNEAGSFVWSELSTSDVGRARAFYTAVFGWCWGGTDDYAEAQVGGRSVAGVMPRPPAMPAGVPDSWLVYFATADLDADTDEAKRLGATVTVPPTEIPSTGHFSVLLDPQGAAFALFAPPAG